MTRIFAGVLGATLLIGMSSSASAQGIIIGNPYTGQGVTIGRGGVTYNPGGVIGSPYGNYSTSPYGNYYAPQAGQTPYYNYNNSGYVTPGMTTYSSGYRGYVAPTTRPAWAPTRTYGGYRNQNSPYTNFWGQPVYQTGPVYRVSPFRRW